MERCEAGNDRPSKTAISVLRVQPRMGGARKLISDL